VTKGAKSLRALEPNGKKHLATITLNDPKALITNDNSEENEAKIKYKVECLLRVRALGFVQFAIGRSILRVAIDPSPIPPLEASIPPLTVASFFPKIPYSSFSRSFQ
jgi:hypothetical protein